MKNPSPQIRILADAWVKKDEHLENQKRHFGSMYYFQLLNVSPFPPRGFFTFLIAVAHGVASVFCSPSSGKYS